MEPFPWHTPHFAVPLQVGQSDIIGVRQYSMLLIFVFRYLHKLYICQYHHIQNKYSLKIY